MPGKESVAGKEQDGTGGGEVGMWKGAECKYCDDRKGTRTERKRDRKLVKGRLIKLW